jgi:hypothetical protein
VFFWVKTVGLYVLITVFAFFLSLVISFCAVRVSVGSDDDSPALGMLWILLFLGVFSLLLPLCLGFAAELVQSKILARQFSWFRGLLRILLAVPIGVGPVYAWWVLLMLREDARPAHWLAKLIILLGLSAVFTTLALRIRRPLSRPYSEIGRS